MSEKKKMVLVLIDAAELFGLDELDSKNAEQLLENREYGLAFDNVVTQLYEYETEIDEEMYALIRQVAQSMEIPDAEFTFLKELIRSENKIPDPVKERLSELLLRLREVQ